jgi:hypothetical protein
VEVEALVERRGRRRGFTEEVLRKARAQLQEFERRRMSGLTMNSARHSAEEWLMEASIITVVSYHTMESIERKTQRLLTAS